MNTDHSGLRNRNSGAKKQGAGTGSNTSLIGSMIADFKKLLSESNRATGILQKIAQFESLSPTEQEQNLPAIFLRIEKFLIDIKAGTDITSDSLRQNIQLNYASLLSLPQFALVFQPTSTQELLLCQHMLVGILNNATLIEDVPPNQNFLAAAQWVNELSQGMTRPIPFGLRIPRQDYDWPELLCSVSNEMFLRLKKSLGEDVAGGVYKVSYERLASIYHLLDTFPIVVKLLPPTLLDDQQTSLLSQWQQRRTLFNKVTELRNTNESLQREIAEHTETEALLQESEERFRQLVSSISVHIYVSELTADGNQIPRYVSPNVEALTGYSLEKVAGDAAFWLTKIIHPDDRGIAANQLANFLKGQDSLAEYRLVQADGNIIWVHDSGRVKADDDGQSRLVFGVVSNITRQKESERALEQQRSFLQQVVDINPHFIFAKDYELRFTMANQAFADAYGTSVAALLGKTDADFNPSTEMVERYNRDDLQVIESGQEVTIPEIQVVNIHGQKLWRHIIKRPILDETGVPYQVLGVATDIDDLKQAQAALADARDQAITANEFKTKVLTTISHDLRTPLGAVLGYTEMLRGGVYGAISDQQLTVFQKVVDNIDNLNRMISELMDQAKLEAGTMTLSEEPVAPSILVNTVQSTMQGLAENKGLQFTAEIAPDVPRILTGDSNRLQQILNNLAGNAIKFTQQGSVHIHLHRPDQAHWVMSVTDTGPGIPIEAQSYIFDAFRQVKNSHDSPQSGSGLGLSIVKQLTSLMNGQVILESTVGQGSTFTVLLPLKSTGQL